MFYALADGDVNLAQANVVRLRPATAALVPAINRAAEASPGFIWRHAAGEDGSHHLAPDGVTLVGVSTWESYEALHSFVYRSAHGGLLRDSRRTGARTDRPATALWWVAAGEHPDVDVALARLRHLARHGPTPRAFSMRVRFDAAGRRQSPHLR